MQRLRNSLLNLLLVTLCLLGGNGIMEIREAGGQTRGNPGSSYGRNPFLLPSGIRVPSKEDPVPAKQAMDTKSDVRPVEVPPPPLKVKVILIGEHIRLASIDQQIVTIGDRIQEERVLEIRNDQVILGKGDQKRTLFLSQSPFRLSVEGGLKGEGP